MNTIGRRDVKDFGKVATRTSSMQEALTKPQREEGLKGKNA